MTQQRGQLLRPGEVAEMFRVHRTSVARWAKDGRLTRLRTPAGQSRYLRDEVEALMDELGIPGELP